MGSNFNSSEQPLNLAKLKAGDDDEWDRAADVLRPIAKAAAMAAVKTRTGDELLSLAHETLVELKSKRILGCKDLQHLKCTVATIAASCSVNLLRDDTGYKASQKKDEPSATMVVPRSQDQTELEDFEIAPDDMLIDAEMLVASKKVLDRALSILERSNRKTGKAYRAVVLKRYYDGFTIEEAAKLTNMPAGTVGRYGPLGLIELRKIILSDSLGKAVADKFGFKRKEKRKNEQV